MNKVSYATHLTRDHYGFYKFWCREPKGLLQNDDGSYKKNAAGNNIQGTHPNVDISEFNLQADEVNLTLVLNEQQYDIFRDTKTGIIVTEAGEMPLPPGVTKAIEKYEAKYGAKTRTNKRKA